MTPKGTTMDMTKEALAHLLDSASRAKRPERLTFHDPLNNVVDYLYNDNKGCFEEVIPLDRMALNLAFGTCDTLAEFLDDELTQKRVAKETALVQVCASGILATLDTAAVRRADTAKIPFFNKDLPQTGTMNYDTFLLYLDQHTGAVVDEKNIRLALANVRVEKGTGITVVDRGASTEIRAEAKSEIKGANAEGMAVTLPKFLHIELRYGTRLHKQTLTFRLVIRDAGGAPVFELVHVDRDEALTKWIAETTLELKTKLLGWRVYEGC
jgi:hypothetical protein